MYEVTGTVRVFDNETGVVVEGVLRANGDSGTDALRQAFSDSEVEVNDALARPAAR